MIPVNPVRLCCGQAHFSIRCPDGLVMCCLCFNRFPVSGLHEISPGIREDVCAKCAREEAERKS